TEFWTFIRRRGVASVTGDGLIEGRCPNCGGDVAINQNAACAHCGALLRSGRYDWVLCEITQESEWRDQPPQQTPGFDDLRSRDPGLSTDDLEDRASVIFWRRAESDRTGDPAPLRKVALDAFVDARIAHRKEVADAGGIRNWFGEIGVGAVDTLGFAADESFDRALVQLTWSGTRFSQSPREPIRRGTETSVIREVFVLCRRRGLRSDPDKGITSAHCPQCGAPVSNSLSNACESCGTVLNDGSAGWVLESIDSAAGDTAKRLLAQADSIPLEAANDPVLPSARGLLIWAIHISAADGEIDPKETKRLQALAAKSGIASGEVDRLISAARQSRLEPPEPKDRDESLAWLRAMVEIAVVDGRIANGEAALLRTMGGRVGFSDADINLMIKRERARVYAESRSALQ
ncbi:MAG: TerB family tellurite resistance protein, partial [Tepidisphaeraceae bacterium]